MKLDWLKLPKYKNLIDFEIHFDETQATTVVLGRNGTGKSNLLEALVEIFRDLELGIASDFEYDIQYICRDHTVRATTSNHELRSRLSIEVDNRQITLSVFRKSPEDYLPIYVFAYYSGWSSRLVASLNKSITLRRRCKTFGIHCIWRRTDLFPR